MKTALIFSTTTGYQLRSFGEAAGRAGVTLRFASDRCDQLDDPWWDAAIPVRFHDEPRSADVVLATLRERPIDGVMAVGDRTVVLAAMVAERLGLPGNSPEAAAVSRNKLRSRRAFDAEGLLVPAFRQASLAAVPAELAVTVNYPVVLKPLALSGSRGVIRVNGAAEFVAGFARLHELMEAPDVRLERDDAHEAILIEEFIPGREFAVEGLLTGGSLRVLALFDKPDPLDGPFFEETVYVTPSRAPDLTQQTIAGTVARACQALGLRHGPIHAECRVNDRGVYILEVAARPIGGLCSRALRFELGAEASGVRGRYSLEDVLLRHALGGDVESVRREAPASAVMMIPIPRRGIFKGVEGVEDAVRIAGVDGVTIATKVDALVMPLPEGRSYLGFIFAHAPTADGAERAVREAHACLRFDIGRDLQLA